MENRLTFLYRLDGVQDTKGGRRSERPARGWMCGFKPVGGKPREIQASINAEACCLEKPRRELSGRPYRKRTHVGEERILRCASESSRRNSAK